MASSRTHHELLLHKATFGLAQVKAQDWNSGFWERLWETRHSKNQTRRDPRPRQRMRIVLETQREAGRSISDNSTFFIPKDFGFSWLVSEDSHLFLPLQIFVLHHGETGVNPKCNTSRRTQPKESSNWLKSNHSACKHLSLLFFETHLNCTPEKDHFSH